MSLDNITTAVQVDPVIIHESNGDPIVTVHADHTVTIHQPDRLNEAAQLFWKAVQEAAPTCCKEG